MNYLNDIRIATLRATLRFTVILFSLSISLSSPGLAGIRENADALYRATVFWSPVHYNSESVLYSDPYSIMRIDENHRDINLTVINNNNEYLPNDTFTYRINCSKNRFQPIGWRVNGFLKEYNHWLWKVPAAPEEKIPAGSMIATARDFACGISPFGEQMDFLYSYWENNQPKGLLTQVWLRGGHIDVSEENPDLRRARLATRFLGSTQFSYGDLFAMCSRREMMLLPEGQSSGQWSAIDHTSFASVGFTKLCSDTPSAGQLRKVALAAPTVQNSEPVGAPALQSQSVDRALESELKEAKRKCTDLGFVAGTPKFGQCVLRLTR